MAVWVIVVSILAAPPVALASDAAGVETCFTPRQRCTGLIVSAIDGARREVKVEAFGFTSPPILAALVSAKRRGLRVEVILDRSNTARGRDRGARAVSEAGVPVWIDHRSGIAHNKVMVIDGHLVITGSFNFTTSADRRNAENVVVLESPSVAARYLVNWRSLQAAARAYDERDLAGDGRTGDVARRHGRRKHRISACHSWRGTCGPGIAKAGASI